MRTFGGRSATLGSPPGLRPRTSCVKPHSLARGLRPHSDHAVRSGRWAASHAVHACKLAFTASFAHHGLHDHRTARAQEARDPAGAARGGAATGRRARARRRVGRRHRRPGRRLPPDLLQLLLVQGRRRPRPRPRRLRAARSAAFLARPADETPVQALRAVARGQAEEMATDTELWPLRLQGHRRARPRCSRRLAAVFGEGEQALAAAIAERTGTRVGRRRLPHAAGRAWPASPCAPPCTAGSPATSPPPSRTSSTRPGTC